MIDVGVTGDQTLGRRAINLLQPEARGRINGLFVGLFFLGGAAGAAMVGVAWVSGGWLMICVLGAGVGIAALVVDLITRPETIGSVNPQEQLTNELRTI